MRWIRTASGEKAHAVFKRHDGKALCGVRLNQAVAISPPGSDDRCGRCDWLWRERGRQEKAASGPKDPVVFEPRFTYRDWEGIP
jgi:anti-sigma factor ChrR (cupin superfamily)